jgi:hypothetical protein
MSDAALIAALTARVTALEAAQAVTEARGVRDDNDLAQLDNMWLLFSAFLVFFMVRLVQTRRGARADVRGRPDK